jgi:hypothetical protein
MEPSGIIFAALDCDADVIEDWNRWYDLEHTPPNVLLDGIMLSHRYVAPPALHAARRTAADSPFAGGRATFLTVYTLTGDPATAFGGMSTLREQLIAQGRMEFPEDKKAVREGDVFLSVAATPSAPTRLVPGDVPFVGHTGVVVIQRRGGEAEGRARAAALVDLDAVHGVWTLASHHRPGLELDLVFVEGDAAAAAEQIRSDVPVPSGVDVLVDAPFDLIDKLRYPWAAAIRASDLPKTING